MTEDSHNGWKSNQFEEFWTLKSWVLGVLYWVPKGFEDRIKFFLLCSKATELFFSKISWSKRCKFLSVLFFFWVSFSFSFNEPGKEGRVLDIQVTRFMSSHDKGFARWYFHV